MKPIKTISKERGTINHAFIPPLRIKRGLGGVARVDFELAYNTRLIAVALSVQQYSNMVAFNNLSSYKETSHY